jgi:hypothetical protein
MKKSQRNGSWPEFGSSLRERKSPNQHQRGFAQYEDLGISSEGQILEVGTSRQLNGALPLSI